MLVLSITTQAAKPKSCHCNSFWTPAFVGVTGLKFFYEAIKASVFRTLWIAGGWYFEFWILGFIWDWGFDIWNFLSII
jgi:hypothetical protein